ncbi:hypothetical protein PF005_g32821 [Phytophthora fragariae]|uniref:Uncharacterized protein n=1 Tax=Phytophthora fragariae TaxID=53985 RepID=A0A6A3GHD1_9STRA|nr:hypothetical protein PF009_g32874 [Phytophthora fragariae]KAE8953218.1 hypothetical protein PF011_g32477 [Phytophthora fragariae]KAE9055437.1 hypothetical protein PF006_g32963 [Phytophthora fragariae]KAE9055972.1 hypothetical protein PF007_g32137 [Phytophthora fragariae]KAE9157468.1 hypothetical protein PF005_g32821 [Phytophthora fragariae]
MRRDGVLVVGCVVAGVCRLGRSVGCHGGRGGSARERRERGGSAAGTGLRG